MYTPKALVILLTLYLTTTTLAQLVGEINDGQIQAPGPAAAPNIITPSPAPAPAPKVEAPASALAPPPAPEAPKAEPPPPIVVAPTIISAPRPPPAQSVPVISAPPAMPPPLYTAPAPPKEAATAAPALNSSLPIPAPVPPYPTNPSMPRYTAVNTLPQPRLENVTAPTVPANLSFVNISPTGLESPSEVGTTAPAPSVVQANTAGGKRVLLGLGVMGGMTLVWVGVGVGVVDGLSG